MTKLDQASGASLEARANKKTIAGYEVCAADYARSTAPSTRTDWRPLEQFASVMRSCETVIEIGSGPGYDADWLEARGFRVRRTDATHAFVELQRARGVATEVLEVVEDDLGGPYAGALAMYVFQHIDRHLLPAVVDKVAGALVENGAFLFSIREGEGEALEEHSSGQYYVAQWTRAQLSAVLARAQLREHWSTSIVDNEGRWIITLAIKEPNP